MDFRVQKVSVPVNKASLSNFMSSSVPHKTAAREEAVPVPFRHSRDGQRGGATTGSSCLTWGVLRDYVSTLSRRDDLSRGKVVGASSAITYVALLGSIAFVRVQGRVQGLVDHRGR